MLPGKPPIEYIYIYIYTHTHTHTHIHIYMRWLDGITDSIDMSVRESPGVADGQGGLVCCSPWSCKDLDTTERLN